jgi:vacuole morphology and inheritance protein 14
VFFYRQLCVYVDAHSVYCTLAEILSAESNLGFSSLMVQVLNMILFTSAELYDFRMQLKDLATPVGEPHGGIWGIIYQSMHVL